VLAYDHSRELQKLIHRLKRQRISRGLSLGELAKATDQARSALSRLESGQYCNPTFNTVYRYARALGWDIKLTIHPLGNKGEMPDLE
jgi:transcriptional regulator with XRE-family HTH domain